MDIGYSQLWELNPTVWRKAQLQITKKCKELALHTMNKSTKESTLGFHVNKNETRNHFLI